jgi:hypothetical protein
MSASVHGDEDGISQVKMETMASWHLAEAGGPSQGGKRRRHARREVRHTSTLGVWWFRPQNHQRGTHMEYATHERFGGLGLKTIGGRFTGLGLKTRVEVSRRNGWHVVASGSSRRGEATGEEARWPSDEDDTGLDHNALGLSGFTQLYPEAKLGLCNSPIK